MLVGENGIITQAQNAKEQTGEATAKEKVQAEVLGSFGSNGLIDLDKLNENLKNVKGLTTTLPIESLPAKVVVDGYEIKIGMYGELQIPKVATLEEIKGEYFPEDTLLIIDGNEILIPGGATVSGIDSESLSISGNPTDKEDGGLVIYITNKEIAKTEWNNAEKMQTTYDQFVWIPVDNPVAVDMNGDKTIDGTDIDLMIANNQYPMAISAGGENYRGILYAFSENENGELQIEDRSYSPTSGYREPANLTNIIEIAGASYIYDSQEMFSKQNAGTWTETMYQKEFNTMVNKVAANGGFWVGRYETSNMNSDNFKTVDGAINVLKGKGSDDGIASVTWYKMYEGQKEYREANLGSKSAITSSMIWGSQWDQIMLWLKGVPAELKNNDTFNGNLYITNAVGMGNFGVDETGATKGTKQVENTGYYAVKNVYDLAGNVYDWTLEAIYTYDRVQHGGYYNTTSSLDTGAANRTSYGPIASNSYHGSRVTLY